MRNKFFISQEKEGKRKQIYKKIIITLLALCILRLGNLIPLPYFDRPALKEAFSALDENNYLVKIMAMYSAGSSSFLSFFSLGILPYINASIIIDLLSSFLLPLEKIQEEGESGRKTLNSYKKILTFIIASIQGASLLLYFKDYFYDFNPFSFCFALSTLVAGAMLAVFITNKIDTKGIGNGSSIIIFTNIILALFKKPDFFINCKFIDIFLLLFFIFLVSILQKARVNIPLVSARQLAFYEEDEGKNKNLNTKSSFNSDQNGLSIKFNQAGIFPIIVASNLIPFFNFLEGSFFRNLIYLLYNFFVISFNYFYTLIFWDPEKISKQLSKASVSIVDIRPGKESISHLQNIVKSSSLVGGICLTFLGLFYDFSTKFFQLTLLNQLNVSSLIILTGVAFEIQKYLCSLYQSLQDEAIKKYES